MKLILLRHGTAEDFNPGGDFHRALVEKGHRQAKNAGSFLKRHEQLPDIVLTSPLVRARQTAEDFCQAAGLDAPVIQDWLASGMRAEHAAKELSAFGEFASVMIVGHEPDFSELIGWFLGAATGSIEVKKGALVCLETRPPSRVGVLRWAVPPVFC
ncbi:MAG: histidine phosphatase family protein [Luteolibacter sp.]